MAGSAKRIGLTLVVGLAAAGGGTVVSAVVEPPRVALASEFICGQPNRPADAPGGPTPGLNPGPNTGGGGGGANTGGGLAPTTGGPAAKGGRRPADDLPPATTDPSSTLTSWVRWWERNKDVHLRYAERVRAQSAVTTPGGPVTPAQIAAEREARDAQVREAVAPVLAELMDDDDPSVRASAVLAAARAGDDRAATTLRRLAAADRNHVVRETALVGLGLLGRRADLPYLADRIADERLELRSRGLAALALGLAGGDDASAILRIRVAAASRHASSGEDLDGSAVLALGMTETDAAARTLIALAADTKAHAPLRAAAFAALGRMDERPALLAALEALRTDRRADVRAGAALALGRVATAQGDEAVSLLVAAAKEDADPVVRHFALLSLGRLGGAPVADRLVVHFARSKGEDRPFAALALGLTREPVAGIALRGAFEGEKEEVQLSALAIALGLHGDAKAIPLLRESLDGRRTHWHQAYAATALAMLGDRASSKAIRDRLLACRDDDLRRHFAVALGLLGDASIDDSLVEVVGRSRDRQERGAAVMALGLLRVPSRIPLLVDLARDRSEPATIRACAVSALAHFVDPLPVPKLARVVADDQYGLRIDPVDRVWTLLNRR